MGLYPEQVVPGLVNLACGAAGFVVQRNEQWYVRGPKHWNWVTLGAAADAPA